MHSIVLILFLIVASCRCDEDTLKFLMVTFRVPQHRICDYVPQVKYVKKTVNQSDLTWDGKKDAYEWGEQLSKLYPKEKFNIADWNRRNWPYGTFSKMTQEAALCFWAGLRNDPVGKDKDWSREQLKTTRYKAVDDFFRFSNAGSCPAISEAFQEVGREFSKNATLFRYNEVKYLVQEYKLNHTFPDHFWSMYETLLNMQSIKRYKLKPQMITAMNGVLKKVSERFVYYATLTPRLKKISGGRLLDDILTKLEAKMANRKLPDEPWFMLGDTKAAIFAASQEILLTELAVLNPNGTKYDGDQLNERTYYPGYGSMIIIELHQERGKWKVKVLYRQNKDQEFKIAKLPGCSYVKCDYDKFNATVGQFRVTKQEMQQVCESTEQ